jgi:putative DNA methylase
LSQGLSIDGTWPVRTERSARSVGISTNALASSIVLVCRKRPTAAPVTTRAEFIKALRSELPARLKLLQDGNIAPVDLAQASIGPGMAIFTRHSCVLEADDIPMTVKTALQLINQALDEFLSEQEAEYDVDTRFAITWFETHGMESGPYGSAETLATARGVAVSGVEASGILVANGGKVRLLSRKELPDGWDPRIDKRLTVWEGTQHLIRRLAGDGERAAADLLARLGSRGEVTRDLTYRLYGIWERKKWADEALNGLVVAWPELTRLAAQVPSGPARAELAI